jgi:signal transduction histidine kinase
MMSNLAALTMAWAAFHLVVGLHNLWTHLRRPTDLEYLAFAVLSLSFSVYCVGAAGLTEAEMCAEGTIARRISWMGIVWSVSAFVAFVALLDSKHGYGNLRLAVFWSVLGFFVNLTGLFFDPTERAPASPLVEPDASPIAVAWVVGACAIVGVTLVRVVGRARHDHDLMLFTVGSLMLVAAGTHDLFVHLYGALSGFYILEHSTVAVSLLLSFMLLARFARNESELEERTAEVAANYRELSRARDDLIEKEQLAAVGGLSAVIAHEIRNPLAILRNAASGLRRTRLASGDRETLLGILDEEADRLGRLSNDLATYARPLEPSSEPIRIGALLEECASVALEEAPHDGIEIEIALEGSELVNGDPSLLRHALKNIVDNAAQSMPAGGRLVVRSRRAKLGERDAIAIEVQDTGQGMDSIVRQKAVDPFFTTRASGTGLGLAIVDRVARAHGGQLDIESSYGTGTTVRITLPTTS